MAELLAEYNDQLNDVNLNKLGIIKKLRFKKSNIRIRKSTKFKSIIYLIRI